MVTGLKDVVALEKLRALLQRLVTEHQRQHETTDHAEVVPTSSHLHLWRTHQIFVLFLSIMPWILIIASHIINWQHGKFLIDALFLILSSLVTIVVFYLLHGRLKYTHNFVGPITVSTYHHMDKRTANLLHAIEDMLDWNTDSFVSYYPCFDVTSSAITGTSLGDNNEHCFQSAIRNGRLITVPTLLLVPDDVILIRPGQKLPTYCKFIGNQFEKTPCTSIPGQDFLPYIHPKTCSTISKPTLHSSYPTRQAIVIMAPLEYYGGIFDRTSQDAQIHRQSHLSTFTGHTLRLSRICVPLLSLTFVVGLFGVLSYSDLTIFESKIAVASVLNLVGYYILLLTTTLGTCAILFLCALAYSTRFFDQRLNMLDRVEKSAAVLSSLDSLSNSHSSFDHASSLVNSEQTVNNKDAPYFVGNRSALWPPVFLTMFRNPDTKYEQWLLTLAEVSSVCCVDRTGILSQPQPSTDKIFFFRKRHRQRHSQPYAMSELHNQYRYRSLRTNQNMYSPIDRCLSPSLIDSTQVSSPLQRRSRSRDYTHTPLSEQTSAAGVPTSSVPSPYSPITLDVRTDNYWPYQLHIEQPKWYRFLSSLKPIGLSALLNAPHLSSNPNRLQIVDHLNAYVQSITRWGKEDINNGLLCPSGLGCLCDLAQLIGFRQGALNGFSLHGLLGLYRLSSDSKSVNNLTSSDPHLLGFHQSAFKVETGITSVFNDPTSSGSYQLLTQASGTLLASLCSDLWDGCGVSPMGWTEYSAMLDFYHRHASASYCMGFSYAPLLSLPQCGQQPLLLQLPPWNHTTFGLNSHSLLDLQPHPGSQGSTVQETSRGRQFLYHVESTEEDVHTCSPSGQPMNTSNPVRTENNVIDEEDARWHEDQIVDLLSMVENQIFLGLVSMQYHVNQGVMDTIKRLNQSCVRFVYFSTDNELRSRVFAERLGLECGWNCHISLASRPPVVAGQESHKQRRSDPSPPSGSVHSLNRPTLTTAEGVGDQHLQSIDIGPTISKRLLGLKRSHSWHLDQPRASDLVHPDVRSCRDSFLCTLSSSLLAPSSTPLPIDKVTKMDSETKVDQPVVSLGNRTESIQSFERHTNIRSKSSVSVSESSTTSLTNENSIFHLSDYLSDNKSRLPCGIRNIRPHLENVDNVPLQVSLFTDCTVGSTGQMIKILREYGDTVCVVGNCYSPANAPLFAQGDVVIGFRPLLPQPCRLFGFTHPALVSNRSCPTSPINMSQPLMPSGSARRQKQSDLFSPANRFHRFIRFFKRPPAPKWTCDSIKLNDLGPARLDPNTPSPPMNALDLAARVVQIIFPVVIDMDAKGFRVHELLHEARVCINNIRLVLTFNVWAPLFCSLLPLYRLVCGGLPALPQFTKFITMNVSHPRLDNSIIWLPPKYLKSQLIRVEYDSVVNPLSRRIGPAFGPGQIAWLWLVVQLFSLSLLDRQVERRRPFREPPKKHGKSLTPTHFIRGWLLTCSRFVPSMLVSSLCELGYMILSPGFTHCRSKFPSLRFVIENDTKSQIQISRPADCYARLHLLMQSVDALTFSGLIFYIIIISFTYANFGQRFWKFRFTVNPSWCICVTCVFLCQISYLCYHCFRFEAVVGVRVFRLISPVVFGLGILWCPCLFFVNECVAWKERRLINAEHRLTRLYFGTKLGMYSPV